MIDKKDITKWVTWILLLEWGIVIGIVSSLKWWNLLIHPIVLMIGILISRKLF